MEDEKYFGLELISASRLGIVKCLRDGLDLPSVSKEALDFGKQLHQAAFEPEKYEAGLRDDPAYKKNYHKIQAMLKACMDNPMFFELIKSPGFAEYVHFFDEPRYGLKCKIKMDKYLPAVRTILDLKSTAAKTLQEFMDSIIKYGYDRQGAFYLDGTEATKFVIIGVSKTWPHKTFTVILFYNHEIIEKGRIGYEELIDYYMQMEVKPDFKKLML